MKLSTNAFLNTIKSGQPQIGLWLSLANPISTEVVAGAGYDWLLIDMEHAPNDLNSVRAQLQVIAGYPETTAIVRLPWNDPVMVKRLLDIGAPGLLFPMVQNVQEAQTAAQSTRYPPHGIRGVAGATRGNGYGRISDYFTRIENETAVLIQVESQGALAQASEMANVDGIDGVFFGPADIGADMGILGQPLHPKIWDAILPVAQKLMDQGVPVGTLVQDVDFARDLIQRGFSFVACGIDASLLAKQSDAVLAKMRTK